MKRSKLETENNSHTEYNFMAHANLAKNAKTRSYDYGSHRSHETCSPPEGAKGNLTDGKSLRSCLSAAPSACLAHAENAENADFASRYALAASGMYTLGETPTHASLRCVLREICEICVRQNNQRERE